LQLLVLIDITHVSEKIGNIKFLKNVKICLDSVAPHVRKARWPLSARCERSEENIDFSTFDHFSLKYCKIRKQFKYLRQNAAGAL
jgi:hypothetical protein